MVKKTDRTVGKFHDYDLDSLFTKKEEVKIARDLLEKYTTGYEIEGLADKNLLRQLIYLEVINTRLQNSLNGFDEVNNIAPSPIIDTLHKNLSKIVEIREKLGLNKDKTARDSDFDVLKRLQKKFRIWMDDNRASRTAMCPHCQQFILFKIRVDRYEAAKHPFFKDRWIFNQKLWDLYKESKITKQEFADILQVSADYIDHIETKIVAPKKEVEQDRAKEQTGTLEKEIQSNSGSSKLNLNGTGNQEVINIPTN
jgi:hypothetical protein